MAAQMPGRRERNREHGVNKNKYLCPERSGFTHSGENVSGLAGEAIMLCMEPLCVRMMQLAFFTFSFM
jgi:hypothetical protein